ncbi:hypothetical protein BDZ89DRAFT_1171078 [Hymenopellis radicata]|nr:hypothetical protein BDZ89DRAFT_1171078 [Hymenopellis radicata]
MSSPRPSTPSVCRLPTLPQTSVTPPRAPIPPPRLIRPAPPRDSAPITSPSKKGKKRVREDKSTESVSPPPQAKKHRALRPSNANEAVPDNSSIPDQRTLRSHPRYANYVASFQTAAGGVKGTQERKKILESDWSVAKIDALQALRDVQRNDPERWAKIELRPGSKEPSYGDEDLDPYANDDEIDDDITMTTVEVLTGIVALAEGQQLDEEFVEDEVEGQLRPYEEEDLEEEIIRDEVRASKLSDMLVAEIQEHPDAYGRGKRRRINKDGNWGPK